MCRRVRAEEVKARRRATRSVTFSGQTSCLSINFFPYRKVNKDERFESSLGYLSRVKSGGTTLVRCGIFVALLPACESELTGSPSSAAAGDGDSSGTGSSPGDGDTFGDGDVSGDGDVYGDGDTSSPTTTSCEETGIDAGANVLRRLSRVEYQLTLQDLFQLDSPPSVDLIPEDNDRHGFTSFSELQTVTAQHLRAYLDTAGALFDDMAADTARFGAVVGCASDESGCLPGFIERFGRLAFRRTLSPEEVSGLQSAAVTNAADAADQLRYATEALLASPDFLYRVEVGSQPEGLSTLSATELASKLSFTVWGRGPSAALLDRAEAGELDTPEGLVAIAREMLSDPKAESFYEDFFRQWLGYGALRPPLEPPADWSDALMPDMVAETDALIAEHAWIPGMNFWEILTANHTTVTPALGAFYGISPDANGLAELTENDPRAHSGILGHASILSQKTDGDKISVRGNWVRSTFLCQELEIPAAIADTLGEQLVGLTSMEIIAKRNEEAACRGCHSAIDPIGVGLAQFDATGRFDATVDLSAYPIDPLFPGAEDPTFDSLSDLAQTLRSMPELNECLTESAFVYAFGRHAYAADACAFEGATNGFVGESGSFASLIFNLVVSDGFRLRRAPTTM